MCLHIPTDHCSRFFIVGGNERRFGGKLQIGFMEHKKFCKPFFKLPCILLKKWRFGDQLLHGASVAEWLERRFNPSAEGRRAGSIPVVALGVVYLSLVLLWTFLVWLSYIWWCLLDLHVILCGAWDLCKTNKKKKISLVGICSW